jgi:hypothetical protein
MSRTRLSIDEAKARLPLPQLFRALNVPGEALERDGSTFGCPFADRHKHGDSRPSFNFHSSLSRYHCFGCGAAGDGPDFVAEWLGIPADEALKKFIVMAGGENHSAPAIAERVNRKVSAPLADEWGDFRVKKEKRKSWPQLYHGADTTLAALASLRGFSTDCLRDMQRMGWLRFCELAGQRAWVLRSLCGRVAQARRLDGGSIHKIANIDGLGDKGHAPCSGFCSSSHLLQRAPNHMPKKRYGPSTRWPAKRDAACVTSPPCVNNKVSLYANWVTCHLRLRGRWRDDIWPLGSNSRRFRSWSRSRWSLLGCGL